MIRKSTLILVVVALLALSIPALALGSGPTIEPDTCPFTVPSGQTVDCGWLTVPADHFNPDNTDTYKLAVAVFHSDHPDATPTVYLEGGPGGNALEAVPLVFNRRFTPFLQNGDFIMFDQRGTGYDQPVLDCPELTQAGYDMLPLDLTPDEVDARFNAAATQCHDRLVGEGIDLSLFTSAQSAADLDMLRAALGYDQWNLYGASYGTRLAQTAMRDFPAGLHAVVLDSSYPPQEDLYATVAKNADRAFRMLFDGCAADSACSAAYPDLETTFYDTVKSLNDSPKMVTITNPLTHQSYQALINGDGLTLFLFQLLYETEIIPTLPQLITEVANGNLDTLALIYGQLLVNQDFVSIGMQFSVQCNEEVSFSSVQTVDAGLAPYPVLRDAIDSTGSLGDNIFAICGLWGAGTAAPVENQPVHSDVPTLILAGQYDPITPPSWGEEIGQSLSHSYFFTFPGMGHGVAISAECPMNMTLAFLTDPSTAPDDSCIADMSAPAFVVAQPGSAGINLEPFTSDTFGFSGVKPAGWDEASPGVYARQETALDPVALIEQSAPVAADVLLSALSRQFGLSEPPAADKTETIGSLDWTLYAISVQGLPADLALAEQNGTTYVVLLISSNAERDQLYQDVLMPVLGALTPSS